MDRTSWNKLKASKKAQIIRFAMDNGVSDIDDIRDTYNMYVAQYGSDKDYEKYMNYNIGGAAREGLKRDSKNHLDREYRNGGKLSHLHAPDDESSSNLATGSYTNENTGIIPINVSFSQEYPNGMNILDKGKQQKLFNWYIEELQRVGSGAFSIEDASNWATKYATQYISPDFLFPTINVLANRVPIQSNKIVENTDNQNSVTIDKVLPSENVPNYFAVQSGPRWQDTYSERQLGEGYGRMMSDAVPANTVPNIMALAENWYNMIQHTHPEITQEDVVNAVNDLSYVRAGAYTGDMGFVAMSSNPWGSYSGAKTITSSGGDVDAHELEHALRSILLGNTGNATEEEIDILHNMFPVFNTRTFYGNSNQDISEMLATNNEVRENIRRDLKYTTTDELIEDLKNDKISNLQLAELLERHLEDDAYIPYVKNVYRTKYIPYEDNLLQHYINRGDVQTILDEASSVDYDVRYGRDSSSSLFDDLDNVLKMVYGKDSKQAKALRQFEYEAQEEYKLKKGKNLEDYTREDWKDFNNVGKRARVDWYNTNYKKILEDLKTKVDDMPRPYYYIDDSQKKAVDAARKALINIASNKSMADAHYTSTGGPLYPFSFSKNPYWKTPMVRYDNGGTLGHRYEGNTESTQQMWIEQNPADYQNLFPGRNTVMQLTPELFSIWQQTGKVPQGLSGNYTVTYRNPSGTEIKKAIIDLAKIDPTWRRYATGVYYTSNAKLQSLQKQEPLVVGNAEPETLTESSVSKVGENQPTVTTKTNTAKATESVRKRVKLTDGQKKGLAKVVDGKTYYTFDGYSAGDIEDAIRAITSGKSVQDNNYYVDTSLNTQTLDTNTTNNNNSNNSGATTLGNSSAKATKTLTRRITSTPVPTTKGELSDEGAFMYRYPKNQVDVYQIAPDIAQRVQEYLSNYAGQTYGGKPDYVFSTKELPITQANDSTFHYIFEPDDATFNALYLDDMVGKWDFLEEDGKLMDYKAYKDFASSIAQGEVLPIGERTELYYRSPHWRNISEYIMKVPGTDNLYNVRSPYMANENGDADMFMDIVTSGNQRKLSNKKVLIGNDADGNKIFVSPNQNYSRDKGTSYQAPLHYFTETHSWSETNKSNSSNKQSQGSGLKENLKSVGKAFMGLFGK